MKTITNITYPAFALFAFACFALVPQARAACQHGCDTSNGNTFLGDDALINNVDGSSNVAIGNGAGTLVVHGSHIIAIGSGVNGGGPFQDLDNVCYIGSIFGEPVSDSGSAQAVYVDQFNVVGIMSSSRRYKHDIKPMDKASEAILALKPVTFKYNSDWKGTPQYGLVAEEVDKVNPELVAHGKNGEITSVHYEQINAMLLNEFLKAHRKVQEQQSAIAELKKQVETVVARLKEQDSKIQKVSDQVELSKGLPRVALDRH